MTIPIPRIRGRVGICDEKADKDFGKYFFEVEMGFIGHGDFEHMGTFGPFETEEIAQAELRNACRVISEECERKITGEVSGRYIDMKDNTEKRWG